MRSKFGIDLFFTMAIFSALIVGFGFNSTSNYQVIAYDYEQTGLDDQIVIRFSHVVAENTPKGQAAQLFADYVSRYTEGKVKVEVYPNAILFEDDTEMDALSSQNVEMIAPAFSKISPYIPEWQVLDLPYALPNYAAVDEALNGDIRNILFESLDSIQAVGLSFWQNGFKQMTSNRNPLIVPEDFSGQSFRTMKSKLLIDQFKIVNAEAVPLTFNETYHYLANGSIDGTENTLSNIYSKKLHTTQKYMTLSNHGYLGYVVLMNENFWYSLPNDIQSAIKLAMDDATAWLYRNALLINNESLRKIKEDNTIEIHEQTFEEKKLWIKAFEPLYAQYESVVGEELMKEIDYLRETFLFNKTEE